MSDHVPITASLRPGSTPAIISYACLGIFAGTVLGAFLLVAFRVAVSAEMAGILGAVLGSSSTGYAAVQGFWLVNSVNPRINPPGPSSGGSGTP